MLIGEPFNSSTKINKNCPPSSIGKGKRLKAPKLILKIAINIKNGIMPLLSESPATFAMPTGPLRLSRPKLPVKVLTKNLNVFVIQNRV